MFRLLSTLACAVLLLSGCNRTYLINNAVKSSEIKSFAYFEPLASVSYIAQKNQAIHSDSLSKVARTVLDSVIQINPVFKSGNKIILADDAHQHAINEELKLLFNKLLTSKKIEGIKIPPAVDSAMKSNGQRFAFATAVTGFDRRAGNYAGQIAKGIGVGILTLGMYTPVPYKSIISLYGMILDRETGEAIFSNRTLPYEKSPTNKKIVEKKYKALLKPYMSEQQLATK